MPAGVTAMGVTATLKARGMIFWLFLFVKKKKKVECFVYRFVSEDGFCRWFG